MLMSSSESDYVPNEHEDVDKYGWFAISSEKNAMLKLFCKFGPLKWNPCWLIMLNELIW